MAKVILLSTHLTLKPEVLENYKQLAALKNWTLEQALSASLNDWWENFGEAETDGEVEGITGVDPHPVPKSLKVTLTNVLPMAAKSGPELCN